MTESEIIRLVKEVIRQEVAPILMATLQSNQNALRSTVSRFSTDTPVGNLRSIQPFGVSSRAPSGTECLIIPIDGNPTHLNMVGHFDKTKPAVQDGETLLYGADGQVLYLKAGGTIHQGSQGANEPVVLGNIMKEALNDMYKNFLDFTPLGFDAFGLPVTINENVRLEMIDQQQEYVTNAATNIVGQKNFVERGD